MSQETDYEKQFQLDLEKAQALSLESLALEKFRMKKKLEKLQTQLNKYSNTTSNSATGSVNTEFVSMISNCLLFLLNHNILLIFCDIITMKSDLIAIEENSYYFLY